MAKTKATVTETIEEIDAAVVTESQVILANHVLEVNGNMLHLEVKDNKILMIRNEVVQDPPLPLINTSDDNLSKALSTAWLSLLDNTYPIMDRYVHMKYTPEQLSVKMVTDWAGYLIVEEGIPYASELIPASKIVSIPTDPGVYQLEYIAGKYKILREMKDTRWEKAEPKWRTQQRKAVYKHTALNLMFLGYNINARYFESTARYIAKLDEVISIPDAAERAKVSKDNIARSVVGQTEYHVDQWAEKVEQETGKKFQSAVRAVKLADGTILEALDCIGLKFMRWWDNSPVGEYKVTAENLENFLSTYAQERLVMTIIKK